MRDLKDETIGTKGEQPARTRTKTPLPVRMRRAGRLMGFCFVASATIGLLALRSVYADVEKAALGLGPELGKVGEPGEARSVRLNGQSVHVATAMDPRGVTAVLDDAEKACEHGGSVLSGMLENLHPEAKKKLPADGPETRAAGVLRKEEGGEGVVACLVRDGEIASPNAAEMARRMSTMVATGELAELGKLRYVFARTTADGAHVVAAWTDGSFNIKKLLPEGGDTPGSDAPNVYRPEGSVRLLTADVEGQPYALRIYDAPGRPADVVAAYDRAMGEGGWKTIKPAPDDGPDDARAYSKNGRDVTLSVQPNGERTMVATVEMRPAR